MNPLPPGWLSDSEAEYLADMARGKTVLEIGAFLGRSTVAMARTAKLVVTIDTGRGSPEHQPGEAAYVTAARDPIDASKIDTMPGLLANLTLYGVREKVVVLVADVEDAIALLSRPSMFDCAFIDGAHDTPSVIRDLDFAFRLVRRPGVIACHDATEKSVGAGILPFLRKPKVAGADSAGSIYTLALQ